MPHPTRRAALGLILATPALLLRPGAALAREPEIYAVNGFAIGGTDPVAYFTGSGPADGLDAHLVEWKGATWRFAGKESESRFAEDAVSFAPQFGGYCAFAASRGYLAPTVPEAWTVHQGQLFLNASLRARDLWLRDPGGNITKGRANWPAILG